MEKIMHYGRNIKRFREILGIKQEGMAMQLGENWNQKKISILEQRDTIDDPLLEQVAKRLNVPTDAIKNFDEEAAMTYFSHFGDNGISLSHFSPQFSNDKFNHFNKILELYESLVKSEKEKNKLLQKLLDIKK